MLSFVGLPLFSLPVALLGSRSEFCSLSWIKRLSLPSLNHFQWWLRILFLPHLDSTSRRSSHFQFWESRFCFSLPRKCEEGRKEGQAYGKLATTMTKLAADTLKARCRAHQSGRDISYLINWLISYQSPSSQSSSFFRPSNQLRNSELIS